MDRICTIVALNYIPQAMALVESVRKIYPEIEVFVLITDAVKVDPKILPSAKILLLDDLDLPQTWLQEMLSFYDPVELATSLKPFLLDTLLTKDVETVTFLDPDILLFSELSDGIDAARNHGIALAPHRLTPSKLSQKSFGEIAFLQYGIFNLGYISVGQKGRPMLVWWGERLHWFCTRFPNDHIFTDQKWMNFVPALFDCHVLRHPGYDLAPWNLDERPLSQKRRKFFVGKENLVFIHFSQMSGILAAGKTTDLWEQNLSESIEDLQSLKIISELTSTYSESLVSNRKRISASSSISVPRKALPIASVRVRRNAIKESIELGLRGGTPTAPESDSKITKSQWSEVEKTLEKSAIFTGIRNGIQTDLPKILQRLRSFIQK